MLNAQRLGKLSRFAPLVQGESGKLYTENPDGSISMRAVATDESPNDEGFRFMYQGARDAFKHFHGIITDEHGIVYAGDPLSLTFDDNNKRVLVDYKLVNPTAIARVKNGEASGVSIDGWHAAPIEEGGEKRVYKYRVADIALCKSPRNPNARFMLVQGGRVLGDATEETESAVAFRLEMQRLMQGEIIDETFDLECAGTIVRQILSLAAFEKGEGGVSATGISSETLAVAVEQQKYLSIALWAMTQFMGSEAAELAMQVPPEPMTAGGSVSHRLIMSNIEKIARAQADAIAALAPIGVEIKSLGSAIAAELAPIRSAVKDMGATILRQSKAIVDAKMSQSAPPRVDPPPSFVPGQADVRTDARHLLTLIVDHADTPPAVANYLRKTYLSK